MICRGGNEVGVLAGHWRMNATADVFLECKNKEACIESEISKYRFGAVKVENIGTCQPPYKGNLCG